MSFVSPDAAESGLHAPDEPGGDEAEDEEEQADQGDRLDIAEVLGAQDLGCLHQIHDGDGGQQRRILEQGDEVVAESGYDRRALAFEYGDRVAIARIASPQVLLSETIPQMSGGAARPTPRWSPSGRYLAVIDFRDFEVNSSLWLIEADRGTVHPLVYDRGPGSQEAVKDFVWHPTEDRILFIEGQAFGTVSVGGTLKAVGTAGNVSAIETVPEQKEIYWEASGPLRAEGGRLHFRKAVFDSHAMIVTWSELSIPLPDFSE